MLNFDEIKEQVEQNTTVKDSVVTLLRGLRIQLDIAGSDPVKLKELSDQMRINTDTLTAAVVTNTSATP